MPTAAKLVAAFAFAAVAFFAAEMFKPAMPPETQFGIFSQVCAFVGLLQGWRVMGRLVGRGWYSSAGSGLRTSVSIVFWCILLYSIREMILNSIKKRYDGVMSALEGTFDILLEFGMLLVSRPDPLIVLAVGGVLGGWLAEAASRRWR